MVAAPRGWRFAKLPGMRGSNEMLTAIGTVSLVAAVLGIPPRDVVKSGLCGMPIKSHALGSE